MTYPETLDYLFSQLPMYQRVGPAAYKADLNNTIALMKHLGNPHENFKSVHIAGTNGKGSVAHLMASVFQSAGYKTGLYTSPHLKDFRERIKINGEMISKDIVTTFVKLNKKAIKSIQPSFFEMTVGMAFQYFSDKKVDIAIIETGMGGRLDSTNILNPELSVITNIGLDHMQLLGDTIEKIAQEKAAIIKKETPVIIGQMRLELKEIFTTMAEKKLAPIYFTSDHFEAKLLSNTSKNIEYDIWKESELYLEHLICPLLGNYQVDNLLTLFQVFDILADKFGISKNILVEGVENVINNTGFNGRWQVLSTNPMTICDTAHNKDGIKAVVNQLQQMSFSKLHFVIGMVDDKNISDILVLLPQNAVYYFCKADIPRGLDETLLEEAAHIAGLRGKSYSSVREAYNSAVNNAGINDLVFISGSTFVVAEVV
ncbi:MAG: bifunctional folylpolyglutamate synthase/dihydrofolate synthase [Bacteroidetes bacterium]|nr:bifunctional folylpolyglutamate synthase/dihydrofolate synthase [Bacteroidota bacterium]